MSLTYSVYQYWHNMMLRNSVWKTHNQPVAYLDRRHRFSIQLLHHQASPQWDWCGAHTTVLFSICPLYIYLPFFLIVLSFLCNPCESGTLMFIHETTKRTSDIPTLDFKIGKTSASLSTPAEGPHDFLTVSYSYTALDLKWKFVQMIAAVIHSPIILLTKTCGFETSHI